MKKRVLLLKPGVTSSKAVLGDYESWFLRACGDVTLQPVELHAGERPPSNDGFDGVIMTGSPLSVTAPTEWMHRSADFMANASEQGTPVLGVCFGHQLLAWRFGARVEKCAGGRELGTVFVKLTEEGKRSPLFAGFPERFDVQATHEDLVVAGGDLQVLAFNEVCGVQAFSRGPRVFGVQFHPEMDAASIRYCITTAACGKAEARETPWGTRLLRQFIELC
ncbi:MAG: homoserine O-succinyltransferase [Archangium sp.]|nr:homoserine O-succinyltransferase [Archangium sp.]MDP3576024.1 homoserine O-succinyltransferase [Archangium sp.]